jgi:hypothetical protein
MSCCLAPLLAIGCVELFRFAGKLFGVAARRKTEICSLILMTLLLCSYFLLQTYSINEVTGSESWSLPLSRYRLGSVLYSYFGYVTEPQASSAEWLSQNTNKSNLAVYADQSVYYNLISFGGIYVSNVWALTNITSPQHGQFVYIGELNTVYNELLYNDNIYTASDTLDSQPLGVIYNNGFSEILTATITAP